MIALSYIAGFIVALIALVLMIAFGLLVWVLFTDSFVNKENILHVLNDRREKTGIDIANELKQAFGKRASTGAIYTVLSELTDNGFVSTRDGEPRPHSNYRRRYFRITEAGNKYLEENK